MRIQTAFASVVVLIGLGAAAQAATVKLAAGPAYSPHNAGGTVSCRVFNNGATAATIASRRIFTNTNTTVALTSDSCNVALAVNRQCAYSAAIPGNFAFTCAITVQSTSAVAITGSMDIISAPPGVNLLTSAPFQTGN